MDEEKEKLEKACQGKSESSGGLNIGPLRQLLVKRFPDHENEIRSGTRKDVEKLCRQLLQEPPLTKPAKPASQPKCPGRTGSTERCKDQSFHDSRCPEVLLPECKSLEAFLKAYRKRYADFNTCFLRGPERGFADICFATAEFVYKTLSSGEAVAKTDSVERILPYLSDPSVVI